MTNSSGGRGAAAPLLRSRDRSVSPARSIPSTLGPASSSGSSVRSISPSSRRLLRRSSRVTPQQQHRKRLVSFFAALISALCAGSITIFSLYAPTFQTKLHYSQYRINGLASASSIAMYIPVPLLGYLCDRVGPAPLALLAAVFFGGGYAGAAACFHFGGQDPAKARAVYPWMAASFVAIGVGTCSMYMSAVATCAKNFGRGKHRGLALAVPIAAFGLSGMWLSQVGDRFFSWSLKENGDREVDVVRFFVFLAGLLLVVGVVGAGGLKIVDEDEIIEEAVEELERSGLLIESSGFMTPGRMNTANMENGYGAVVERANPFEEDMEGAGILDPRRKDAEEEEEDEEARLVKQWVLNAETRRFLTDHTMWCFALGFFFMIGPGEAFINNMGTVIKTLYPAPGSGSAPGGPETSAATHVSIVGITSTIIRLLTGTLTDFLAPSPQARHIQIMSASAELSHSNKKKFAISRVAFLLFFAVVLSVGLAGLAAGLVQNRGDLFWIISGLVGAGYGAVFSLTPIIITVIWGVENFATNWGIVAMFPALGATMWGLVYSAVYQDAAKRQQQQVGGNEGEEPQDSLCYGVECYAGAFWAMAASVWVACGLVLWAWKGKGGWSKRGILV